ncbi:MULTISPECIES: ExeM/NucH family extracellular endonuclease [Gammaproteobacteria]|uniref:ExeM/NucH family extracellular endonuclease n=1 Tax=Gammaproteobacteria TaxID=1236 RepID=UPI000DD00964|nr:MULTISPECIES: ExeM/NucH family extracellular endonuclease [Gammaproteobacteria]RTE85745.1 ExeM/NucH family extracellular endonuclease [Aliidiomarina sp. B3213]TCZ90253.1 ExeM/NucH family extracellular endonuclease [Lysobacter sp. N42]
MRKFSYLIVSFTTALLLAACGSTPVDPNSIPIAQRCGGQSVPIDRITRYLDDVVIVEGVVSATFQDEDELGGFFIQEPGQTLTVPRPATFVQSSEASRNVRPGDRVRIEGTKGEYAGGLQISDLTAVTVCASNQSYSVVPMELPFDYVAQLDNLLHQRIRIAQPMTVIGNYNLARHGTLDIATERLWIPTQITMPGLPARDHSTYNFLRRIVLDDGSLEENPEPIPYPAAGLSANNTVRAGDTITGIEGVLVKIGSNYHIHPIEEPIVEPTNPRTAEPSLPGTGDIRVAAFNVLNYFNGDGMGGGFPTARGAQSAQEFERQRQKIIQAMLDIDADVYGVMEIENDGFSSQSAIADLVRGLQNAAPAGARYSYVIPEMNRIGGDAIAVGLIYRSDKVSEAGTAAANTEGPFAWGSRPPLAQTFRVNSNQRMFTVVANHFKSKGSCPDSSTDANANRGDGQGCWNALRTETSVALARWLRNNPTGIDTRNTILLGDFNAYAMEDPMMELRQYNYINIANRLAPEGYSYIYRGEMGSLDHILTHGSMMDAVKGIDFWNINADEAIALQYSLRYKSPRQQNTLYAPTPYRSSDHDPVVIEINSIQLPQ